MRLRFTSDPGLQANFVVAHRCSQLESQRRLMHIRQAVVTRKRRRRMERKRAGQFLQLLEAAQRQTSHLAEGVTDARNLCERYDSALFEPLALRRLLV